MLLYPLRDFELKCDQLRINGTDKSDYIEEVQSQGTTLKWRKATIDKNGFNLFVHDDDQFDETKEAFICKYCDNHNTKGNLIKYLK